MAKLKKLANMTGDLGGEGDNEEADAVTKPTKVGAAKPAVVEASDEEEVTPTKGIVRPAQCHIYLMALIQPI